ncbi:non-ribosomal peptide synthetase [Micromonospora sp. B006]|uniref:non-ribosomal peptide synthetase n=1 Tax=Micromonospora sp. B006 TaxID=2201999 RepID=UPI000E305C42|nr:non-ribosomal peptide synthetase [Micromonospora sp. B006]
MTQQEAPLSFGQQRLWFLEQLVPGNTGYVNQDATTLVGELDADALDGAFQVVLARHDALRTRFRRDSGDGNPRQWVEPTAHLTLVRLAHPEVPGPDREALVQRFARAEAARPFDLASELPLRCYLIRWEPTVHTLLILAHHIVVDGWSLINLRQELAAVYNSRVGGVPAALPELRMQYPDFARWQRADITEGRAEQELEFWRGYLDGAPDVLDLPTDRPRPEKQTMAGEILHVSLPRPVLDQVRHLASTTRTTPYMVLTSMVAVVLQRYTGQRDIVIGSPVAGRTRPEFEPMIGLFLNMIPLRLTVEPEDTVADLLKRTRTRVLRALSHQDLPFEQVVQGLNVTRRPNVSPIFQVSVSVNNLPDQPLELHGLRAEKVNIELQGARYDLTADFAALEDGLRLRLQYNSDLFDRTTVRRMVGHLSTVLAAAAREPGLPVRRLPLVADAERDDLLRFSAPAGYTRPDGVGPEDVLATFARQVEKQPDAQALSGRHGTMTYHQLDAQSDRMAAGLLAAGVRPGSVVGVLMDRSPELVATVLGIWKANGVLLPLDQRQPDSRLAHMLRETEAALLLVDDRAADRGAALAPGLARASYRDISAGPDGPDRPAPPDDLAAYIMYTSGSTGTPKGVTIQRSALAGFCGAALELVRPTPEDVVLAVTTFSFDISLLEYLVPLLAGASVRLQSGSAADAAAVQQSLTEEPCVTLAGGTPTVWKNLLGAGVRLTTRVRLMLGGESMPKDLGRQLLDQGIEFWNFYGPTEATVYVTAAHHRGRAGGGPDFPSADVGAPFGDNVVYVLDAGLHLCPLGIVGDVYLAGPQLAQWYHARPGQTAERFVADPYGRPGDRMYRTGDLGRWSPAGHLLFEGRADSQVKIRGFRVELAEIEFRLRSHPGVDEAVVGVRDRSGVPQLVARLAAAPPVPPEAGELRRYLADHLPEYMIPAVITFTDALPVSMSGKIDRRAALDLEPEPAQRAAVADVPASPEEGLLCNLFVDLLDQPDVSGSASFFELGGNSLLAVQLVLRLQDIFQVNLSVADIFAAPTPAALAERLASADAPKEAETVLPLRTTGMAAPIICLPPRTGLGWCYAGLLRHIPLEFPVYGLQSAELAAGTQGQPVEQLVERYLEEIEDLVPVGPCILLGWSLGGLLADEIAQRLRGAGRDVPLVVLYDAVAPLSPNVPEHPAGLLYFTAADAGADALSSAWAARFGGPVEIVPTDVAHLRMFDREPLRASGPRLTARLRSLAESTGR